MSADVRSYRVPKDQAEVAGMHIGGGWFPFKDGILEVPGSHAPLVPSDFRPVEAPEASEDLQTAATAPAAQKRGGGDRGEPVAASKKEG